VDGRVANPPADLPPSSPIFWWLLSAVAFVALLPVLLPALLPLIVLALIPLVILGVFFGRAGIASGIGCLGSLTRVATPGASRSRSARPGGLRFRVRSQEGQLCEVEFRGRAPTLELGDEIEISGIEIGAVLHSINILNKTTREKRASQLLGRIIALGVIVLIALSFVVGR
jgi:hypothetical protein